MPVLKRDGQRQLDEFLSDTVAKGNVPAVFLGATDANGTIYYNQAGDKVFGDASAGQVDEDTTTELFSQTKLVTCIAAMQMVDRGLVSLDSQEDIEKHLPEIGKLPLLEGYEDDKPILVEAKKKVTLRMLMSHSAGMTYTSMDPTLAIWHKLNPLPGILAADASIASLCTPFVYEPGTSWRYSHSIDWVGILIERISGLSLEDYFKRNIFEPSGAKTLTFFPNVEIQRHKMSICFRDEKGEVQVTSNGWGRGRPTTEDQISRQLLAGGAGLFGTQKDYLAVLRAVLQCEPSYGTKNPLLTPKSYDELFKPSIPRGEGFDGCEKIRDMVERPNYIEPKPTPNTINYSIGFLVNLADFTDRRKANSGCWSGVAKTHYWIDPTTGIAAICGTQLLSPPPDPWYEVYVAYEKLLYANLE